MTSLRSCSFLAHPAPCGELLGPVLVCVLTPRHHLKVGQVVIHGVAVSMVNHHPARDWPVGGDPDRDRALLPFRFADFHVDPAAAVLVDANRLSAQRPLAAIRSPRLKLCGGRQVEAPAALYPRDMARLKAAAGTSHPLPVRQAKTSQRAKLSPMKMRRFASINRSAPLATLLHETSRVGLGTIPVVYAKSVAQPKSGVPK